MSIEVTCAFQDRPGFLPPEQKTFKTFRVWKKGERGCPDYIPRDDLEKHIHELEVGQYLETEDGYVSPVVKTYRFGLFRIAATKGYVYRPNGVIYGNESLLYDPPVFYKAHKGISNGRVTRQLKRFAWEYAKTGNYYEALSAGYPKSKKMKPRTREKWIDAINRQSETKKAIVAAFREQLALAEQKEEDFAITRIQFLLNEFEDVLTTIKDKIKEGTATKEELGLYKELAEQSHRVIESNSEMLGYKGDEKSFKMTLEGKSKGFEHTLPAHYEEIK